MWLYGPEYKLVQCFLNERVGLDDRDGVKINIKDLKLVCKAG